MSSTEWVEQVLALPDAAARRHYVQQHSATLDDDVAARLKEQADRFLVGDVQRSLEIAEWLLLAAEVTFNPRLAALGLLASANARSLGGLGEYERAVEQYDEAAAIYHTEGDAVSEARAQVGKVFSLAMLGRYDEALAAGQQAAPVLEASHQWRPLINLTINLAIVFGRQRADSQSLAQFDRARSLSLEMNGEGKSLLARIEANRAIVLRNLGRFDDSIQASRSAWEIDEQLGAKAAQGHDQLDLASTYMFLGRTNEALELLYAARDVFLQDGRPADAIEADLGICHCLLQLRRFHDVIEKCQEARSLFGDAGRRREVAEAAMVEAAAYTGLRRFAEALAAVADARSLFEIEDNEVWIARVDLEAAALHYQQGRFEESLAVARRGLQVFRARQLAVQEAQAYLISARSAAALGRYVEARQCVDEALAVGEAKGLPDLIYPSYHLLGQISEAQDRPGDALAQYDQAIEALERLRGNLMVEFRADFLQDKQVVYEDVVRLSLELDRPDRGLEYAERAKSRALLDLVAYRLDLSLTARGPEDRALVDELTSLRLERDRLVRRGESPRDLNHGAWMVAAGPSVRPQQELAALEKQITELWHKLLIRNAEYAREASLWQVHTDPFQPHLPPDALLLEYFVARDQVIAFAATRESVTARPLGVAMAGVQQLFRMLQLNLKAVPRSRPEALAGLIANANGVLAQLHQQLIAPIADLLDGAAKLIIVPHGALHYLPFHALRDEQAYLVERYEISYLPGASLLRFCSEPRSHGAGLLTVGHSFHGQLPYAVEEARLIAGAFRGQALLEEQATTGNLIAAAPAFKTLHVAAHGDFRPDNPLFSGLALEDGWLTTLDIFNLRLSASLVTLSACQTGRNVISGGDELLGLMRAFLYAGAASLMLSLWPVEDRSAGLLMEQVYAGLAAGRAKAEALRLAQLRFIHRQVGDGSFAEPFAHPYFWAPFFLVGDGGPL